MTPVGWDDSGLSDRASCACATIDTVPWRWIQRGVAIYQPPAAPAAESVQVRAICRRHGARARRPSGHRRAAKAGALFQSDSWCRAVSQSSCRWSAAVLHSISSGRVSSSPRYHIDRVPARRLKSTYSHSRASAHHWRARERLVSQWRCRDGTTQRGCTIKAIRS